MKKIISLVATLIFIGTAIFAQPKEPKTSSYTKAVALLNMGDYADAKPLLERLIKTKAEDPYVCYRLGYCYTNLNINKPETIELFKKAVAKFPMTMKDNDMAIQSRYYLGQAHHANYQFDEALATFDDLRKQIPPAQQELLKKIDIEIVYAQNAIELSKTPMEYRITNMGASINSSLNDHSPVLADDENMIVFTSNRAEGSSKKNMVSSYESIFMSLYREGKWLEATRVDEISNPVTNIATVGMSHDGQYLLLYQNDGKNGNIYISMMEDGKWLPIQKMDSPINSSYNETDATFSSDSKTIYFVSDRPGGFGGKDIYMSTLLPKNVWGPALNLGPAINTPFDEESPFIHTNDKSLYFSSMGHKSIGGYDIFMSEFGDDGKWSTPKNLGFPINTPDDDLFFNLSPDGQRVYFASDKKDGQGGMDIYMMEFPSTDERTLAAVSGFIYIPGETADKPKPAENAVITVYDYKNGAEMGIFKLNPRSGKYMLILPSGKEYTLSVTLDGYTEYLQKFDVPTRKSYQGFGHVYYLDPVILKSANTEPSATK